MSSHLRSNLRLTFVLSLLLVAMSASAADVKILFDVDHNQATGCNVMTTAGTVPGIEMVVITTWDPTARTVTGVSRQQCMAGVLGSPVAIDTSSWAVGTDAEKNSVVETHVPTSIFGPTFPMAMQVAFTASNGPAFEAVVSNEDGAPMFFPLIIPGKHRAVASPSVRTIVLDGSLADWAGLYPLPVFGEGGAALRFNAIYAWPTEGQFYFAFALGTRGSAPTVFDWDYTVLRGGALNVGDPGVLANALDPSGKPLTAQLTNGPQHGSLTLNPGGGFGYVNNGSNAPVDHFHYRATDGTDESNQATVTFHVVDGTSPQITSANSATFTVGAPGTFTVTAVGIPSPTISFTGTLPAGVTFTPAGSHATIAGTPGPGTGGKYTLFITASNGVPPGANQTFTLTINQAPTITSANNAHFQVGVASNFTVTTSGFPAPSLGESGALPGGITFTDNNNGTATLGGNATPGSGGTYPITITATNVAGSSPQSFTIVVCNGIVVISPLVSSGTANTAFSQTFTQTGAVGAATFSVASGTLPTGLTLATNGTLSGTPTQTGSFPITVKVTDSQGCTGTGPTYTLTINCQTITVTNPGVTTGTANAAFSQTFTASNTIGATTFSLASGTLPTGLTLGTNGTLSGTPTQTGSFPITVKATDANGCSGTGATYTLVINCQTITVTNPGVTTGTAKTAFSQTFTASNTIGATTFTLASGTLPTGLTLATNGTLSGTPTQTGSFPITVKATDANGCNATGATYTLVINCQTITVTNPGVSSGTAGTAFSQTFTAGNTVGAVTFTLASGTLPTGLTLGTNGTLSGTPTQTGSFPITVKATDANGCQGTGATYTLVINCQTITVTNPGVTTATVGTPFSQNFTQTGAIGGATFTTASTLPTGLTLSTGGVLSGTPTQSGSFPIVVTVTDGNGCTGTGATYTLVVSCQTITVTNPGVNSSVANAAFSQTFTQTGALAGATFSLGSGTLPTGLTLSTGGVLSGTPTQTGSFPITVKVTDGHGCTGTGPTYTLTITCQTITVTNPATTTGTANAVFSQTFTAGNTIGTTTFTLASGTLPTGLTLGTNGTLSGTPTQVGSFPITVKATDANGCNAAGSTYTLVIGCQTITVTNPGVTTGTANAAFSQTFTAGNTIGTVTFSTASTLPTGLSLSSGGVLSGTPTQTGTFPIVVTATDGNGCSGSGPTYTLVIGCQTITVTNPVNTNGTVNIPFSEQFSQSGAIGTATFTTASPLPTGLTLSTSGLLSGTPTQAGSFPIVVTVTDSNGCTGNSATYTLVIACQTITVTNPATSSGPAGTPLSVQFTQTGGVGTTTFSESGTLPTGLTFHTATGVLDGTPTQGGTFPITVTATDSNGCQGTGPTYNLVITCPTITVTNPGVSSGTAGTFFTATFSQSGGQGTITWSETGALPTGITLNTSTGVLSGTTSQVGTFPITVTATDQNGCQGTGATYNLTFNCQTVTITNPGANTGTVDAFFTATFTATGILGTATWSETGALPAGITLNSSTGVLSGTPTVKGSFPITVKVTDTNGCFGTSSYTLTINCQTITVTKPGVTTGTVDAAFSQNFTQAGAHGTATFTLNSGSLPAGLSLSTAGVLSGTPTVKGTFPITVLVTDSNGCTGTSSTYTLVINCQTITVTNPGVTTGTAGTAFSQTFLQSAAHGTATFSTASTLPTGFSLSTAGVLSGTTTQHGIFPIVVTVTDSNGCTGTGATYNLNISCNTITVTNPVNTSGTVASPFSEQFTQSGALGTPSFSTASTLPTGLTLNSSTGFLSGTPTQSGTFPIVVTATDSNGCTGNGPTYTLVIACNVITVTNPGNSTGTAGTFFTATFTQSGGTGTITWSETGALPSGITLNTSSGVLSGTTSQTGSFPITVTATDINGCQGTGPTYTLVIGCQTITITNPAQTSVQAGATLNATFTATGILGTATWSETGSLPSGITLNSSTGVLSGTTNQLGSYPITVKVIDTNGCFATSSYTLTVTCPTITVVHQGPPAFISGVFNLAYGGGQRAVASGGTGSYTYAVTSGALPTSLSLDSATGVVSGTPSATGTFAFTITATDTSTSCTGFQSFSIRIGPQVISDTYNNLVDNTQAFVSGGTTAAPSTPAVTLSGSLLANDLPAGGVTVTAGTFATTAGGSVTVAADGTFLYTPKANPGGAAITTDTFNYTGFSDTGGTGTPGTGLASVTLNLSNRVWYVKNNAAGGGNGQSQSPFNTLAAAQAASAASDILFVYNGDGTTTGQNAGVTLKSSQQLIGEGVALVVNANTLVAAGTKPQITNATAASDAVTLNDGNTVKGLTITGATRDGIAGNTHAGFTADTLTVQNNTNVGVDLISMTGTVAITNSTISTVGNQALTINNGTAAVTADNTNTINGGTGTAVEVLNRPGSAGAINIGATLNNGQIQVLSNTSGTISFTGSQTLSNGTVNGVTMTTNSGATIDFSGTLNVTTTTGTPFQASGGGTLNVTGTANLTSGAAANGLSLNGMTIGGSGVTFTSVNTTGATTGINLVNDTGTVTVNGGTLTNGTTGIALQGSSTNLSLAGVTVTGPTTGITNTTNFGTLTIGSSVNVSAATALNLTTGAISGTFANVSSTGGTNGVNLSAITGTWGATAGTLTGASGATFNVSGTSGTVTWGGNISQSNGANVVTIAGSNTNTITVSGNVTSSGTSTGLSIGGSSGSYSFNGTNAFSGAGGITLGAGGESGSISFSNSTTNTVSGDAFVVDGTTGNVTAAITYNGTIDKATSGSTGFLVKVNKLNSGGGSLTMSHAPAAAGNLKQNFSTASGISVTNSSSGSISISNASVTFVSTAAGFTGSGNTGTINLDGIALAGSGNKAGMLISGGGTINVANGAGTSSITMTGGTGIGIDGTTASYTGTLNLTNTAITGNGATAVALTSSTLGGTGSSINNAGPALVLNTVALSNGAGMSGITSSGGVNGISLTGVTGGTYTIGNGGSLSGNVGAAFLVSGGSATLSYAGNISGGTQSVNISGATGGTITFSGAIGSSRILLNSNTGATINFTGALTLSTGASPAFTATAGGTVSSTAATSTLTTTSGIALNVANTTIGGSGLTFKSISSSSASSGIVLNTTGAGSLTVTGDGASDPANSTRGNTTARNGGGTITLGSGGTISGATSSAISLTSTGAVSLTSMNINSPSGQSVNSGANGITASTVGGLTLDNVLINGFTGNSGLRGTNVTNLSMQHTDIDGNGTTVGTETNNNWNVRLDELAGTGNWQNSLFFNSRENIVGITQGVTNTSVSTNMTITNCEFRDTTTFASPANDAFLVSTHANAVTNITATGSTFKNVEVCGFQYAGNDNDTGTINVRNSIFENTGSDIILAHGGGSGGNSTVNFDTSGNTTRQLTGNPLSTVAFDYFLAGLSGASSVLSGTVKNNTIGNSGVTGSGSHVGDGMDANATGSGTLTMTLGTGPSGPAGPNTIHQIKNQDAFFGEANSGSAKLNIFMHSNSFNTDNGTATDGAHLVGGAMTSDSSTLCVDMSANTLNGPGYSGAELDTFGTTGSSVIKLVGYGGAQDDMNAIATFVNTANTTVSPALTGAGGFIVINGGHIKSGTCGVAFP
jgi:hypothetical protein